MNVLPSRYHQAVQAVVDLCLERHGEALDLASLAREAGYSPFHFHRVFGAMMGESPSAFLRRLRLECAAHRLREGVSVSQVAMDAGFGSLDAFSRAFRQAFGALPSEFRKICQEPFLPCPNGVHFGRKFAIQFQSYGGPQMNIRIEESPAIHVLGIRHIGPYPTIGASFGRLFQEFVGPLGLKFQGSVAVFHDDPEQVPAEELRSDALLVVAEPTEAPEGMVAYTLPPRKYAIGEYTGPYAGLSAAWQKFCAEDVPALDVVAAEGLSFELYLSDMNTTPPEKLRTDLYLPVV